MAKYPRWRVRVDRANGVVEFSRLKLGEIKEIVQELKDEGQNPSIAQMEPLVIEYILKRDARLGINNKIVSIELEPDV